MSRRKENILLCEFKRLIYKAVRRDIIEIIKKLCK